MQRIISSIHDLTDLIVDARDRGARFDGSTDDSAAIQAVIDAAAAAGGGAVRFPAKRAVANLVLKDGVYLVGPDHGRGYQPGGQYLAELTAATTGYVIDTPTTSIRNCGVIGVNITGLGTTAGVGGIRLRNVVKPIVAYLTVNNTSDEGVLLASTCGSAFVSGVQILNALRTRSRAAAAGALDVAGTDHYLENIEASTSMSIEGTISDANLYCRGVVVRSTFAVFVGVYGEVSDIGFHVDAAASRNRFVACRADLNYGHGFLVEGGGNTFDAPYALNNGQAATNTYDGFQFASGSASNQTVNLRADATLTAKHRYGLNDLVASATQKNRHANPLSTSAATAQYLGASSNGSAFSFPTGGQTTLTANSATPDVSGYEYFITANTNPTTITAFTGLVPGQRLTVFCNDTNTTIAHNGSTITLLNAGNLKLRRLVHYEFIATSSTAVRMIHPFPLGVTADAGDAAKSLQARVNEETQIWNTPLTADRAVALSTTGAYAGARFRIVRTAAATGAFSLNVGSGPLKALAAGQWCDVDYDGAAWLVSAAGSL